MAMPASRSSVRAVRMMSRLPGLLSQMWKRSTEKILMRSGWAAIWNMPEAIISRQLWK